MSLAVFSAVLCAALLHAAWNAVIKIPGDALVKLTILSLTSGLCALSMIPFVGLPPVEIWPFLAASVAVHLMYKLALLGGYRYGDLSLVYPIARGIAPVLVAVGALVFAGEMLSPLGRIGLLIVSIGIMSLAFLGSPGKTSMRPVLYALLTGFAIASYTIIDGVGARISPDVYTYIAWGFLLDAIPLTLLAIAMRRGQLIQGITESWKPGFIGGVFSFLAYALVIWAMTHAPLSHVSAVRETSVIFAALIGVFYLKETAHRSRVVASILVACGVILLQFSAAKT